MSAETSEYSIRQPQADTGAILQIEHLEDHFPFLHDELDYYRRCLGIRAVLVRTLSCMTLASDVMEFDDILRDKPTVTDIFLPVGDGEQLAGFHTAANMTNWSGNLHAVQLASSNSVELSLKAGIGLPLSAWAPHEVLASQRAIDNLVGVNPFDVSSIETVYTTDIQELAQSYSDRAEYVMPLDLPTLVAIAGMRKQLRDDKVEKDAVMVVAASSHNRAYTQLASLSRRKLHVASGYTSRWPSSSK
ncbi:hypothetical protein H7Y40_01695 [Pedobacter sp.]|nr:hypothetical protein [Candidatus Saccharibacteria bacterium]